MFDLYRGLGGRLNIRVSVDGYKDNHDITRKTAEGKGSWTLLEGSLPRFRVLKEKYGVKINIINTINKSTCKDLYFNYTRLYELTGLPIGSLFVHEDKWESGDFDVIKEQIALLYAYGRQNKVRFSLCNAQTECAPASDKGDAAQRGICSAGIGSLTVNHAGDIIACHRAYYYGLSDTFKLGNIGTGFDPAARALMYELNNMKLLPRRCQECLPGIRHRCHICIVVSKKNYGGYYNIPDTFCALMREIHNLLLDLNKSAAAALKDKRQARSSSGKKQIKGIVLFSLSPLNQPKTLLQFILNDQRTRGIAAAPDLIAKMCTVKDVEDKATIMEAVRQSFHAADVNELLTRVTLRSFHMPDGTNGKFCVVYDKP
jgi:uncharacterized protein